MTDTSTVQRARPLQASTSPSLSPSRGPSLRPSSRQRAREVIRRVSVVTWLLLLAAVAGFGLFAYQTLLVPQTRDYHVSWHGARWVGVAGSANAVAYFRKTIALEAVPAHAFLTVQGSQTYALYVDGNFLTDTVNEFKTGVVYDSHIYDVAPFLQVGVNTVALRVVNTDAGAAQVRAALGLTFAGQTQYFPSDPTWKATSDPAITRPAPGTTGRGDWRSPHFDDAGWPGAAYVPTAPAPDGYTSFDPATLEMPLPPTWISAGASRDAYFFHAFTLPTVRSAWLRVGSTGTAAVYLNGEPLVDQPARIDTDQTGKAPPPQVRLTAGVYDIGPRLRQGLNLLAIHVVSAGLDPAVASPQQAAPGAIVLDLLLTAPDGAQAHLVADKSWYATSYARPGWARGDGATIWGPAAPLDRSSVTAMPMYLIPAPQLQAASGSATVVALAVTALLFLLFCLVGVAVQCLGRWSVAEAVAALDRVALSLLPVLGGMALLCVIAAQPLVSRPFPFTPAWLGALVACALLSLAFVLVVRRLARRPTHQATQLLAPVGAALRRAVARVPRRFPASSVAVAFAVVALLVVAGYVVTYQLSYESYWQDELSSIASATGVLQHGIPAWPTGFVYTKAELFSYMLAVVIHFFGYDPNALRLLSAVEYLVSLLLVFLIGRYFLGRRTGLVAMLLMVCSPLAIWWARQARMYQQAQLCVLLLLYLFYRAVQPGARTRYIYLSMLAAVAMYLSHEETFIVLPALLIYFLATQRLSWIRNKHWWIAGLSAIGVIVAQLVWWRMTRRPILGTDHTVLPLIHFSPSSVRYYARLLFSVSGIFSGSVVNFLTLTTLAIAGTIIGLVRKDRALRYLSLFWIVPLCVLIFMLSVLNDRYLVPILPLFALLAAATIIHLLDAVGRLARARLPRVGARAVSAAFATLLITAVALSLIPSTSGIALAVSRTFDLPYHHLKPEYQDAGDYILAHWQPGDAMISLAPIGDVSFYAVKPDYKVYQGKVLTIFEYQGHISDNREYTIELLNEKDFNQVLLQHHRIWLFAAAGRTCCVGSSGSTPILDNFTLVFEGRGTFVYLHTG